MKIPNAERAFVDIRKLRDYCLSMEHPRGKHKARVFRLKLGLTAEDAEELKETLLTIVETHDAVATESAHYGTRYVIDFVMIRGTRTATVRSSWIIRSDEDFPRLTSCYVL
jgi:hypothetical protein